MIVVTGTKRSGTSMWMQILVNGGFPYIGEAFPRDWGSKIRDANPEGFYESALAGGVWWRTNPSPRTGAWQITRQLLLARATFNGHGKLQGIRSERRIAGELSFY